MSFLLGVPGKLKTISDNIGTLLTRWSAAKAALLDTSISSRAASSTALSTVTWTGARATALDSIATLVTNIANILSNPKLSPPTSGSFYTGVMLGANLVTDVSGLTTATGSYSLGYKTVINLAGKGVVSFLNHLVTTSGGGPYGHRLTIDGVVVFNLTAGPSTANSNLPTIGVLHSDGAGGLLGISFEDIPFKTSFVYEVYATSAAGTYTVKHRYRQSA